MGNMGSGIPTNDPIVVAAFHRTLVHQGLIVAGLAVVVMGAWHVLRSVQLRRATQLAAGGRGGPQALEAPGAAIGTGLPPEPAGRRIFRIGFGLLWILDGVLQAQASMPNGLIPNVVKPASSGSPGWLVHLVDTTSQAWTYHPVTAAAATVWIQVGIGAWLLVAPRGYWSRLGGMASLGWGLAVWIFGESMGGVLAPGLSWLTGSPGAAVIYAAAGALLALPDRAWAAGRLGRRILRAAGLFFVGSAVLQAWPGRGFWQGQSGPSATAGSLVSYLRGMAGTPQPALVHAWLVDFAAFDAAHGWAVNLFVVGALAGLGAALVAGRPGRLGGIAAAAVVLCVADWVLVEDMGFFGGVGTDPNSMLPLALLVIGAWAATRPSPVPAVSPVAAPAAGGRMGWVAQLHQPAYALRTVAVLAAAGVTLVGAAPMAAATADPNADQIIEQEVDAAPVPVDLPAPAFHLSDQYGRTVSTTDLRGRALAVTFLDPSGTDASPTIASEFRRADDLLGADRGRVDLIAIDVNRQRRGVADVAAFDRRAGLSGLTNWFYLTGSPAQLEAVGRAFRAQAGAAASGSLTGHGDVAFIVDPAGRTREVLDADPGPADPATESAFSVTLSSAMERALTQR